MKLKQEISGLYYPRLSKSSEFTYPTNTGNNYTQVYVEIPVNQKTQLILLTVSNYIAGSYMMVPDYYVDRAGGSSNITYSYGWGPSAGGVFDPTHQICLNCYHMVDGYPVVVYSLSDR